MDKPDFVQLRIVSDTNTVQNIEKELIKSEQVNIISSGPIEDQSALQFGLIEVAAIAAIVQGAFYLGELSIMLYRWHEEEANNDKKILIRTPLGRYEFVSSNKLSPEEINSILQRLAGK